MPDVTTIRLKKTTKDVLDMLRKKYHYKTPDELLIDMQEFFFSNKLNPRHHKEIYNHSLSFLITDTAKETDARLRKFLGYEFKNIKSLLGQADNEITLATIKEDIEVLARWMIENVNKQPQKKVEFDVQQTQETPPVTVSKTKEIDEPKFKRKMAESIEYLLEDFKTKAVKKGGQFEVSESDFLQFELSLKNLAK